MDANSYLLNRKQATSSSSSHLADLNNDKKKYNTHPTLICATHNDLCRFFIDTQCVTETENECGQDVIINKSPDHCRNDNPLLSINVATLDTHTHTQTFAEKAILQHL